MTSDDQYFIDLLSSIPQDVARYGNVVADFIDKQIDVVAAEVKRFADKVDSSLASSGAPSLRLHHAPPPPKSFLQKTSDWVSEHRTAVAVIVAFTGTSLLLLHHKRRSERRKRKAKRTLTGAKKEVVVLASTIHDPLTRSLAIDLERRGYIVYVTLSSQSEHDFLERGAHARQDIRSLWMDLSSSVPNPEKDIHPSMRPIYDLITKPQTHQRGNGFANQQYTCSLAGVVFVHAADYSQASLVSMPSHDLIDTINTRLLSPMLIMRQFLPLLNKLSHPTAIVVAYPSIPSSLTPPLQTCFATTTSALSSFTRSLRSEIILLQAKSAQPIQVTEIKLGNLDIATTESQSQSPSRPLQAQQALPWHSGQRAQAIRQTFGQAAASVRGSSVRAFHDAVFDSLYAARSLQPKAQQSWARWFFALPLHLSSRGPGGVVYAGRAAWIYDQLSGSILVPRSLVDQIVRLRCQRDGWGNGANMSARGGRGSPSLASSMVGESAAWERV